MSETNQGNQQSGRSGNRRYRGPARRGYRGRNNRQNRGSNDDAKDGQGVPILKYGPRNNFLKWKEKLRTACMEEYGDLGRMIDLNAYWEPEEVLEETYQGWKTSVIKKEMYLTATKDRMKVIAKT